MSTRRCGPVGVIGVFGALLAGLPAAADPRIDYMLHCEGCHLAEGAGWPGLVPSLQGNVGRVAGVAGGRDYLIRVPGVANAPLSSEALAALLNWLMRTLNAETQPADFVPFREDEVERARKQPLADPLEWRAAIYGPFSAPPPAASTSTCSSKCS